jgi:hypothetical protein
MKQLLVLRADDYAGKKVRRLKKMGRVELLSCYFDPEEILQKDYWFVRLTGFNEERDRPRLARCGSKWGNGYFWFAHLAEAEAKFQEMANQPESLKEEETAQNQRRKNLERLQAIPAQRRHRFQKKTAVL